MKLPPLYFAALVMGIGVAGIPLGDAAGRLIFLHGPVEPVFVAWSRFCVGVLLVVLLYRGRGFDVGKMRDWRLWLRGFFLTASILSILTSLQTEPIANVFAAFFIGPILAYFGAAIFLGERITWLRTLLLLFSFVGVLLVVKPGGDTSFGILFAFLAGVFYSAFLVSTRWLSHVTRPRMLLLSNLIVGALVTLPWGISSIPALDTKTVLLVLWSGAGSALGNLAIVVASSMVDASRLAPLVYMQLVYATLIGIVIFGDFPDYWAWTGLSVMVVAGFASFFLQQNKTP